MAAKTKHQPQQAKQKAPAPKQVPSPSSAAKASTSKKVKPSGHVYSDTRMVKLSPGLTVLPFDRTDLEHRNRAVDGDVYVDPVEAAPNELELVRDTTPAITLTRNACSSSADFASGAIQVFSLLFNIPAAYEESATSVVCDKRGNMVELDSTGVLFRNVSHEEVTVHANCPVGFMSSADVFARVPGFKSKGRLADSVKIKPGSTVEFMVNWKNKPAGYAPIRSTGNASRPNIVACTFTVQTHNDLIVPSVDNAGAATGSALNPKSEIVSLTGVAKYSRRSEMTLPNVAAGVAVTVEEVPHFSLNQLTDGLGSLWGLDPLSAETVAFIAQPTEYVEGAISKVLSGGELITDLTIEGSFYGLKEEKVSGYGYEIVVLATRMGSNGSRPAALIARQSVLSRIALLNTSMTDYGANRSGGDGPGQDKVTWNIFKYDTTCNRWVLWDDLRNAPTQANYVGNNGHVNTPTDIPVYYFKLQALATSYEERDDGTEHVKYFNRVTGVEYTEEEFMVERFRQLQARDPRNVPMNSPKVDTKGVNLRDILGVLVTIGKIAGFVLAM